MEDPHDDHDALSCRYFVASSISWQPLETELCAHIINVVIDLPCTLPCPLKDIPVDRIHVNYRRALPEAPGEPTR